MRRDLIYLTFAWGRCSRFFGFEEYSFPICLGTGLAILCSRKRFTPSCVEEYSFWICLGTVLAILSFWDMFGDGACDPSAFAEDSLQVVWGRCLGFFCFWGALLCKLFGDGACDCWFLRKIYFKFVWGRCFRLIVLEEYSFRISVRTVLAILSFWGVITSSQFVWGRCLRFFVFLKKI